MAYKKWFTDPMDLPTLCPVCDGKRNDPAAIAIHNEIAAHRGCRSYGLARTHMALTAKPVVRRADQWN